MAEGSSRTHHRIDRNDIHDIINTAAAGKIEGRLVETLDDWSNCLSASHPLCDLVGDIARVEIRENEYIRLAGDTTAR